MTSLLERAGRTAPKVESALTGGLPQVNLLPPEIRAARRLRTTKRYLVLAVATVVLVALLGYGWALLQRHDADAQLAAAQTRTNQLTAQQSTYAQVPLITSELSAINQARTTALGTEVLWGRYYDAFAAVLPSGVTIDSLAAQSSTTTTGTTPAGSGGVAQLTFALRSPSVPDSAALLEALDAVPGFSAATVSSVSLSTGTEASYYSVSGTLTVTTDAYSHRFTTSGGN